MTTDANGRHADHPISAAFLERWSPRAFDARTIGEAELMTVLEAARWAPSCANSQPWRFVYGLRPSPAFDTLVDLLTPGNQAWARNASALVFAVSSNLMMFPGATALMPSPSASFDTGAAWAMLALQARALGLHTHAMAGFDRDRAMTILKVPADHRIEAAIALGWPGDPADLPDAYRAREVPSPRRPLSELVFPGSF